MAGTAPDRTLPEETVITTTLPPPTGLPLVKSDLARNSVDFVYCADLTHRRRLLLLVRTILGGRLYARRRSESGAGPRAGAADGLPVSSCTRQTRSGGVSSIAGESMRFRFDAAPTRIYWELTRACDLACTHCRASANAACDPRELSAAEIARVVDELAAECRATIIFTGGDPLKRPDFFEIVAHTVKADCPVSWLRAPRRSSRARWWRRARVTADRRDVAEPRWLHSRHGTMR